jgi:hypothetical protein
LRYIQRSRVGWRYPGRFYRRMEGLYSLNRYSETVTTNAQFSSAAVETPIEPTQLSFLHMASHTLVCDNYFQVLCCPVSSQLRNIKVRSLLMTRLSSFLQAKSVTDNLRSGSISICKIAFL